MVILFIFAELAIACGVSGSGIKANVEPLNVSLNSAVAQEEHLEVTAHSNFMTWCQKAHSTLEDQIAMQQEQLNEAIDAASSYRERAEWLRKGGLKNISGVNTSLHLMQSQSQLWRSTQMKSVMEVQVRANRWLLGSIDNVTAWEKGAFAAHERSWAQLHIAKDNSKQLQLLQDSGLQVKRAPAVRMKNVLRQRSGATLKAAAPLLTSAVLHSFQPPPGLLQLPTSESSTNLLGSEKLTPLITLAGVNAAEVLESAAPSALTELSTLANNYSVTMLAQLPSEDDLRPRTQGHLPALTQVAARVPLPQGRKSVYNASKVHLLSPLAAGTVPISKASQAAAAAAASAATAAAAAVASPRAKTKQLHFLEKKPKEARVHFPSSLVTTTPVYESLSKAATTTASPAVATPAKLQKHEEHMSHHSTLAAAMRVAPALPKKNTDSEMEAFIHDVSNFVEKPLAEDVSGSSGSMLTAPGTASNIALSSDLASLMGLSQDSHTRSISFLQVAKAPSQKDPRAHLAASALAATFGQCQLVTLVEQQTVDASIRMLTAMKTQLEKQRPRLQCPEDAQAAHKRGMLQLAESGTQLLEAEHATLVSLLANLRNFQASSAQMRAELVGLLEQTLGHTYQGARVDLLATMRSVGLQGLQAAAVTAALSEQLQADAVKAQGLAAAFVQEGVELARLRDTLDHKRTVKEKQIQEARAVVAKATQQLATVQEAAARGRGCSTELLAALSGALRLLQGA